MVIKHVCNGLAELEKLLVAVQSEKLVLLFTGSATATSPSWCPDCVVADPIIEGALDKVNEKPFDFAKVYVGSRDEWKDPKCQFRVDPRFKLTSVPTLLRFGTSNRLNDSECQNIDLVNMLLEDV